MIGDAAAWAQTPFDDSAAHIEIRTLRSQLKRIESAIKAGDLENRYRIDYVARDIQSALASVEKVQAKDPSFDISSEIAQLEAYQRVFTGGSSELDKEEHLVQFFTKKTYLFHKLTIRHAFHDRYDFRGRGAAYLALAQEFDTADLRAKIKQAAAYDEGAFYELKSIHQFLDADYPRFADTHLRPVVNRHIEAAYGNLEDQPAAAFDHAQAAVQVSDAVLQVLPENVAYARLRADAEEALRLADADDQKNVLSGAFHREHRRQIVFANQPIAVGGERSAGIKDRFTAGESIHARAYLDRKLKGFSHWDQARIKVFLDDNQIYSERWFLPSSQSEDSTLEPEIVPDPAYRRHVHGVAITARLAKLSPRRHRLKVVLVGEVGGTEWAVGELELDATVGVERLAEQSRVLSAQLLGEVEIPRPKMHSADLEREMARLAEQRLSAPWRVARVVIRDSDWRIDRHETSGVIVQRLISTWVVLRGDDRCRMVSMSFVQPYQGSSSYGRTEDYGVGESRDIGCDKIR